LSSAFVRLAAANTTTSWACVACGEANSVSAIVMTATRNLMVANIGSSPDRTNVDIDPHSFL